MLRRNCSFFGLFWVGLALFLVPLGLQAQTLKLDEKNSADDQMAQEAGDDDDSAQEVDWTQTPANEGVQVEAPTEAARSGAEIKFKVIVDRGEPIFVFGCRPLQPEMFGEGNWETVPGPKCPGEGVAQKLDPGSHEIELAASGRKRMIFRATLSYGVGCTEGVPLSAAHCRDFATAASGKIRVTPALEDD